MDNIILLLNFTLPLCLNFFFAIANTYHISKPAENHCSSLLHEHGEVNTLKLICALCPPRLFPDTLLHFSVGRKVRPLQPTTRLRGNHPKIHHKLSIVRDSREQIPSEGNRTCH